VTDYSERGLLGCVMVIPSLSPQIFGAVGKKDFSTPRNWIAAQCLCKIAGDCPEFGWDELYTYMVDRGLRTKFKNLAYYLATLSDAVLKEAYISTQNWRIFLNWDEYEAQKKKWIDEHPNATPAEYEAAIKNIVLKLGA
jgi:hypothetical protein